MRVSLRKNGNFEPATAVERSVRAILHPQIARFFLFDGEMLNEYEDLLRDSTRNSQLVRQSIDQILGLPALQRAAEVFDDLRLGAERRQLAEARLRQSNDRVVAEAQQKEEALQACDRDMKTLKATKDELEDTRGRLRERLAQFTEVQADIRELDRCEEEILASKRTADELRERVASLIGQVWWAPLEPVVARMATEADDQLSEIVQHRERTATLSRSVQEIEAALEAGRCELCGQSLSDEQRLRLATELDRCRGLVAEAGSLSRSPEDVVAQLTLMRPFRGSGALDTLAEMEGAARRQTIQQRRLQREVDGLRERIRAHDRSEIGTVERDLERCVARLAETTDLLAKAETKRRDSEAALHRIQNQIRSLPTANQRVAREAAMYDALRGLFEEGIGEFRNRLRLDVERVASEIHGRLTTESGYAGLRINDQYGLSLVNESGRITRDRSAGSEQIVALALIGALSKCATREGPIVMDTPFGRLDRGHRTRVLEFLSELSGQVVLLVQSGEIERERDLVSIRHQIATEYRIERAGASDRSRLVEMR
jgi:DNA sulfur modification protein DndD